mmetsp:Transcript_110645/g.263775  ORF Transcript_110645/g.263775 Transcript_110645/m.263775 type:complete len:129 (+) Transcript_110645:1077-1463(+)
MQSTGRFTREELRSILLRAKFEVRGSLDTARRRGGLRHGFKPLLRRTSDEQQLDLPMHGVKAEHLPVKSPKASRAPQRSRSLLGLRFFWPKHKAFGKTAGFRCLDLLFAKTAIRSPRKAAGFDDYAPG